MHARECRHFLGLLVCVVLVAFHTDTGAQTEKPSVEEVREFMAIAQIDKNLQQIFPLIMNQMWTLIDKAAPGIQPGIRTELRKETERLFLDNMYLFTETIIPIYRKNFSRAEILAMTKFYKTPEGKSAMSKLGIIFKESSEAGRKIGGELGRRAYEHVIKRLREKGYQL